MELFSINAHLVPRMKFRCGIVTKNQHLNFVADPSVVDGPSKAIVDRD